MLKQQLTFSLSIWHQICGFWWKCTSNKIHKPLQLFLHSWLWEFPKVSDVCLMNTKHLFLKKNTYKKAKVRILKTTGNQKCGSWKNFIGYSISCELFKETVYSMHCGVFKKGYSRGGFSFLAFMTYILLNFCCLIGLILGPDVKTWTKDQACPQSAWNAHHMCHHLFNIYLPCCLLLSIKVKNSLSPFIYHTVHCTNSYSVTINSRNESLLSPPLLKAEAMFLSFTFKLIVYTMPHTEHLTRWSTNSMDL